MKKVSNFLKGGAENIECIQSTRNWLSEENGLDAVVDPNTEFKSKSIINQRSTTKQAFNLYEHKIKDNTFFAVDKVNCKEKFNPKSDSDEYKHAENTYKEKHVSSTLSYSNLFNSTKSTIDSQTCQLFSNSPIMSTNTPVGDYSYCKSTLFDNTASNYHQEDDDDNLSTTSEQLPWLMQVAKDKLETASNISLCSHLSERPGSNMSSLSDVSGYEEEFCHFKKFLNLNDNSESKINIDQNEMYINNHINDKELLIENEKLKLKIQETEKRVELFWSEKYQELLHTKIQCESQLESAEQQIKHLMKSKELLLKRLSENEMNSVNNTKAENNILLEKLRNIEICNSDMLAKLNLMETEISTLQNELINSESENKILKVEIQEKQIDLDAKNSSIQGLKSKISEQYSEIQHMLQEKVVIENKEKNNKYELEALRKSEKWYTDQLHQCQNEKSNLRQELMFIQSNIIDKNNELEKNKITNLHLKNSIDEIQQKGMKEKQILLKQLQIIQADMIDRETIIMAHVGKEGLMKEIANNLKSVEDKQNENKEQYEISIIELQEKINQLEKIIENKNHIIERCEMHNKDLLIRLTTTQQLLNEKELSTQQLNSMYYDLEMKYKQITDSNQTKENIIFELKNDKVGLQLSLHAAHKDKMEVDEAVNKLRLDFSQITHNYQKLKKELQEKDKIILSLEREKQELFMNNNWRICEVEQLQNKILDSKVLQANIMELKNIYNTTMIEKENLNSENMSIKNELSHLKNEYDILHTNFSELKKSCENASNEHLIYENDKRKIDALQQENEKFLKNEMCLQNKISDLNKLIVCRESQLLEQSKKFEVLQNIVSQKEQQMELLLKEKESTSTEYNSIRCVNKEALNEIALLKKEISHFNLITEQYNNIFKTLEMEKADLKQKIVQLSDTKVNEIKHIKTETSDGQPINLTKCDNKNDNINDIPNFNKVVAYLSSLEKNISEFIYENIDNNKHNENMATLLSDIHISKTSNNIVQRIDHLNNCLQSYIKKCKNEEASSKTAIHKKPETGNKLVQTTEEDTFCQDNKYDIQIKNIELTSTKVKNCDQNQRQVSTAVQTDISPTENKIYSLTNDIRNLKMIMRVNKMEYKEKYKRYEINIRTLLKKVKEHMRGRKIVEKELNNLKQSYITMKLESNEVKLELDKSKNIGNKYKNQLDCLQSVIFSLGKELELCYSTDNFFTENIENELVTKLKQNIDSYKFKIKANEETISILENKIKSEINSHAELNKKYFIETRESFNLKKQIQNLQYNLKHTEDLISSLKNDLTKTENICSDLKESKKELSEELLEEKIKFENKTAETQVLIRKLDEILSKENSLQDKVKTLNETLNQKIEEIHILNDSYKKSEKHWREKEMFLRNGIISFQTEIKELHTEMNHVLKDKFILQKQCTELRVALQGLTDQNKILKMRCSSFTNNSKSEIRPNFPSPTKYDDSYIMKLLQQNNMSLNSTPLNNLQNCLDSLKQEMTNLQKQVTAKTQLENIGSNVT